MSTRHDIEGIYKTALDIGQKEHVDSLMIADALKK